MFVYLRYFSAISFFAVVLAAIFVGMYFRSIAQNDLQDIAEKSNISLAQGFINTVWRKHSKVFAALQQIPVKNWKRYKQFIHFSEQSFMYFEGIPVAKLNIYTPKGEPFLSTNQAEIIVDNNKESSLFAFSEDKSSGAAFLLARSGEPTSNIMPSRNFLNPDGTSKEGVLVRTVVPIISDSYVPVVAGSNVQIDAIIEVFYDVTPQWNQLYRFQVIGTFGIIVIFIILFAALYFTSRRAETIIARQHEKNLELTAQAARAEAANREKSKFLANISHELRTPLNAIIGFSDIIKNEALGGIGVPEYRDYAKDIHTSGSHLLSLINDILDFSKAEAGKLELEIADVDASKIIRTCMRLVSPRAEEAGVNLAQNVPKGHFVLTTDAKKLKQVMLNLLSNAIKFTPKGGEVKVTLWQDVQTEAMTVEVSDTGIGIAPKDISKALAPFGQVDSELSRKYEGTGLGLPLTKKFIEFMGGTFDIRSEVGKGTTVSFSLPKVAPEKHWKKGAAELRKSHEEENMRETEPAAAPSPPSQPPAESGRSLLDMAATTAVPLGLAEPTLAPSPPEDDGFGAPVSTAGAAGNEYHPPPTASEPDLPREAEAPAAEAEGVTEGAPEAEAAPAVEEPGPDSALTELLHKHPEFQDAPEAPPSEAEAPASVEEEAPPAEESADTQSLTTAEEEAPAIVEEEAPPAEESNDLPALIPTEEETPSASAPPEESSGEGGLSFASDMEGSPAGETAPEESVPPAAPPPPADPVLEGLPEFFRPAPRANGAGEAVPAAKPEEEAPSEESGGEDTQSGAGGQINPFDKQG